MHKISKGTHCKMILVEIMSNYEVPTVVSLPKVKDILKENSVTLGT